MKEVTAAISLKDNKVLIAQRAPKDNLSGKWEFSGGKLNMERLLRDAYNEKLERNWMLI